MKNSELIQKIMFEYQDLGADTVRSVSKGLPPKLLRWLATNHPDNMTRKIFLELTNVTIGEETVINQGIIVSDGYQSLLYIGSRVAISPNVTFLCESAPNNSKLNLNQYVQSSLIVDKKIVVGDDAWIGANAVLMPGITIGCRSIIGAGAVVTQDVPDDVVVAGVPAKIIRQLI